MTSPIKPGPKIVNNVMYGCDAEVAAFVNGELEIDTPDRPFVIEKPFKALGIVDNDNKLIAGAYFTDFMSGNVSDIIATVAVRGGASVHPTAVVQILWFPFEQLKVQRISAYIAETNIKAVEAAQHLGFVIEGRKRRMCKDGASVLIMGLLPNECPFWVRRKSLLDAAGIVEGNW